MTYISQTCATAPSRPSLIAGLTARLAVWKQRRALKALDDSALNDIGLSRRQANTEARRSFWDAPDSWRC
ncbi:DUF1127 domain-containing protein [Parasedimentitalea psychrophila]|uniref:DUF1127 domain-containing protein n=1 Tax=Parasedimentitalea psychrophila TaxID=2997337 RepID=A0A9Y2KWR2_9RHOB|nr:DUF1127 domain-containing protein [Parasedimentitalea psychrophila]WIY23963.1 DUF1127 domain-containing protein [Parasedimentitalea psychrophila]